MIQDKLITNDLHLGDSGPENLYQVIYRLVAAVEHLSREVTAINIKLDSKYVTNERCALLHEQRKQEIVELHKETKLERAEALAKIVTMVSVAAGILWVVFNGVPIK